MNGCPYLEYDAWNGDYDCTLYEDGRFCDHCEHGAHAGESETMDEIMAVLWEAHDGMSETSAEELLARACQDYANGADGACPVCGSFDIRAHEIKSADGSVWSDVDCPVCGAEWQEVFEIVQCDFEFGSLPLNWRELIQGKQRDEAA